MNRKGQALVEFVIILPIFLMILFIIADFGMLIFKKNSLESTSTDIVRMIKNGDDYKEEYPNIGVKISDYKGDYKKIEISQDIDLITPLLDRVLGNPCHIKTERVIKDA